MRRLLIPLAFGIAALLPVSASAQQMQPNPGATGVCGDTDVPMLTQGELAIPQPDTEGRHDEGVLNYSAVRGSIVHMEGNLVLLHLPADSVGNAGPTHDLAGDTWAVVQLPAGCSASQLGMGADVMAVGTPTDSGILKAIEVTPAG